MNKQKNTNSYHPSGIQSVENALFILNCLKMSDAPLSLSELSRKTNMSKSKLQKYLISFLKLGVLSINKKDLTYTLGPTLIELGLHALQRFDVAAISEPFLKELKQELKQASALAIWNGECPIIVKYEESGNLINVQVKVGFQAPLLNSSTGKCFAAFMDPSIIEPLIVSEISRLGLNRTEVETELQKIREDGYAYRDMNYTGIPGNVTIASPVFDYSSEIVAVLCLIGFAGDINTENSSKEVMQLKETANQMTQLLSNPH